MFSYLWRACFSAEITSRCVLPCVFTRVCRIECETHMSTWPVLVACESLSLPDACFSLAIVYTKQWSSALMNIFGIKTGSQLELLPLCFQVTMVNLYGTLPSFSMSLHSHRPAKFRGQDLRFQLSQHLLRINWSWLSVKVEHDQIWNPEPGGLRPRRHSPPRQACFVFPTSFARYSQRRITEVVEDVFCCLATVSDWENRLLWKWGL